MAGVEASWPHRARSFRPPRTLAAPFPPLQVRKHVRVRERVAQARLAPADRVASTAPGSLYGAAAANVPGAGEYDPELPAKHVAGAVKLQQAYRRRQSRGIFAARNDQKDQSRHSRHKGYNGQ